MRLLDHLISRRPAMPDQPDDITRLRKASYALEALPETIAFPQRAGDEPHCSVTLYSEVNYSLNRSNRF